MVDIRPTDVRIATAASGITSLVASAAALTTLLALQSNQDASMFKSFLSAGALTGGKTLGIPVFLGTYKWLRPKLPTKQYWEHIGCCAGSSALAGPINAMCTVGIGTLATYQGSSQPLVTGLVASAASVAVGYVLIPHMSPKLQKGLQYFKQNTSQKNLENRLSS